MSNIEYRVVIKFFIRKGLNATEISKELQSVYKYDAPSYRTITKRLAKFKESEHAFEDSPRMGPLIKIFKPYNGSDCVIGKSLSIA